MIERGFRKATSAGSSPRSKAVSAGARAAFVRSVLAELRERAKPERREVAEWYVPTAMQVLGVPTPGIREVVRAQRVELRGEPTPVVVALAQALVDSNAMEARQVGYELIETHPKALDEIVRVEIEQLGRGIDNWASVDGFSCSVAGRAWNRGRLADGTIRKWARSKDRWWRRAALVSTVPLNLRSRGGSGDPERTLEICERLHQDGDDMVIKALSWALRSLIEHDEAGVREFLGRHDGTLAARVKREVGNKLRSGRKSGRVRRADLKMAAEL